LQITSVFTDKTEYSRYHLDLSVITATILLDTATPGATFNVALFRLDVYGAVASKTFTTTAGTTQYQVTFDLNKDAVDSSGIYRARCGDYVIQVTDPNGNITNSNMFAVSIVPVKEIKEVWAFGVNFHFYEILRPLVQPRLITGVEVTEVSPTHFKGPFPLVYDATAKSLSWNGGTAVPIVGLAPQQLVLMDKRQMDYIIVNVVPILLPTTSQTETLVIDNGRLEDQYIIRQVRNSMATLEQQIMVKLEPTIIDTDPAKNGFADQVGDPVTYYRPRTFNKWMSLKIPYPSLLQIQSLTGYFNETQSATVPLEWVTWNERTGMVELVPSSAATVMWTFYNSIFVMAYLFNYESIPGFWHYRITAGLRDLNDDRGIIREAIGKKATLELLNSAGSAYRAGYASQSLSRDGVSESNSYTSSAMYGVYGGHFVGYRDWLDKNIPKLKQRYAGIQFISI
jgi:hypothetical protein